MTLVGTGGSKLAQLVTNHVLGNIYRNMLAAIVYCDGVTDELGEDRGSARPGLEDLLLALFVHFNDSFDKLRSHKRAFLNTSAHIKITPFLLAVATTSDLLVGAVVLLAGLVTHSRLAPRGNRRRTTDRALAFAAAVRVITRVPPTSATQIAGITDMNHRAHLPPNFRSPSGQEYADLMLRQNKILGNMLGADIDFVVRGIDSKTRSVVASRREAMMRKRQTFYFDLDAEGKYRIYEGRIVQARVIAVAEKVIRVEVFGVETSILARDLAWDWIGDAHERFSVGDEVLVRILNVRRNSLEDLGIRADIKSTSENTDRDNLQKCRIQGKYAGKVTDVHKGVVYVRLANGVNAVAHSCYDYRMPGKKDDVSFAVTHLDVERGIALGIITRIIRQNL